MSNLTSPTPSHLLLSTSPYVYSAPLRSPSPLTLELPKPRSSHLYSDSLWNAGILLADQIVVGEIEVKGKRVLELGCGVGLPGILAAKKGAELVVLTDYDDANLIEEVRRGVDRALPRASNVQVVGHSWGEETERLLRLGPFDLILGADLLWQRPSHSALIRTFSILLSQSPSVRFHLSAGFHSGRQVVRDFFADAASAGLVPVEGEEMYEISVTGERKEWERWGKVGEREMSQEERNRWTLVAVLRGCGEEEAGLPA